MSFCFDVDSLKKWFVENRRDLPWRRDPTAYQVWVSEVMLQQTRVDVVIPYYERWMKVFPCIEKLSRSSQERVIKMWEGLGYYSRARNLHVGARYVVEKFNGILPSSEEELKKIKGLGPYTVGAIRSFAFHEKAVAIDGNVMRVLARYFMIKEKSLSARGKKTYDIVRGILPEREPWVFNEALIELGALICSRKAKCFSCPLYSSCLAYKTNSVEDFPKKEKKMNVEFLYRAVAIIQCGNKVLLERPPKGKVMAGLHEFPYIETKFQGISDEEFSRRLKVEKGLDVSFIKSFPEIIHTFTRYRVRLRPRFFSCEEMGKTKKTFWQELKSLKRLAFSSGHRKILNFIEA